MAGPQQQVLPLGQSQVSDIYANWMSMPLMREYYGGSNFFNVGLWAEGTASQAEASLRLMDRLLALLPENPARVLDVACGLGGTTRYLAERLPSASITAVDVNAGPLAAAREAAPGNGFARVNATALAFQPDSFDAIVSVEAAFHFNTRAEFVRQAFRALRPGGRLVLSDMLFGPQIKLWRLGVPVANDVASLEDYAGLYRQAGFEIVELADVAAESWQVFVPAMRSYVAAKRAAGELAAMLAGAVDNLMTADLAHYAVLAARKP